MQGKQWSVTYYVKGRQPTTKIFDDQPTRDRFALHIVESGPAHFAVLDDGVLTQHLNAGRRLNF